MKATIQHINPEEMHQNPAFSQAVVVQGAGKTIYIGGQNAVNAQGEIVGDTIGEQTEQAMRNVQTVLAACGATFKDLVKMNIYLVQGQDVAAGYAQAQHFFDPSAPPPVITAAFVAGLGRPEFLLEIDGIAVLAE